MGLRRVFSSLSSVEASNGESNRLDASANTISSPLRGNDAVCRGMSHPITIPERSHRGEGRPVSGAPQPATGRGCVLPEVTRSPFRRSRSVGPIIW